jgi:hypothetical protein
VNKGDIVMHTGVVTESASDMSIAARIPGLAGDIVQDDIRPAFVSPVRWRPREDDQVTIMQRMSPGVVLDDALSWLGWEWDDGNVHLVPPWIEPGQVSLFGVDGRTVIVLDDDETLSGNARAGVLRIGRMDADQPVVLGTLYKAGQETFLDQVARLIDETRIWLQQASTSIDGLLGGAPVMTPLYTAWLAACHTGAGTSVKELLVGTTVPPGNDVKSGLADQLSDFIMVAKEPDPNPYTGEEE